MSIEVLLETKVGDRVIHEFREEGREVKRVRTITAVSKDRARVFDNLFFSVSTGAQVVGPYPGSRVRMPRPGELEAIEAENRQRENARRVSQRKAGSFA